MRSIKLWFAFKLVSLNHWIQRHRRSTRLNAVVICFQISIFEPLNTARHRRSTWLYTLWFAFKLVSLNHWIQLSVILSYCITVVICFQISIFEPLNTANEMQYQKKKRLWFAFKLVSLNHWIQHKFLFASERESCDLLSN